jgi:AraC-like DNA-binding protein
MAGNFLSERVHRKTWCGVTVTAIDATLGEGAAWHKFASNRAIVSVVLNEVKGRVEARTDLRKPMAMAARASATEGHLSIIPEGCDAWGYSDGVGFVREARLIVDRAAAREAFGERLDQVLEAPALMRIDGQVHNLARLLSREAQEADAELLYVEGLMAALFARLSAMDVTTRDVRGGGLTPRQLRLVTDYMVAKAAENISLGELTELVGLSRSQFGRAFKASTGKSPHHWHREARLEVAKALLREPDRTLVDVALSAGFSEQSHFNRVFRSLTGVTPGAWRRQHASGAHHAEA